MATVDRIPFTEVPPKWAFDPEVGPFVRKLLDMIWQLRNRTGGDTDYITEVQGDFIESEAPVNYDIRELKYDRDKYNAERITQRKIRTMQAEFDAMRAEIQSLRRQNTALLAKIDQFIAEVETSA